MIFIQDDYFESETFKMIQEYCEQEFRIVTAGEKDFSILDTPNELIPLLQVEGYDLILTFIRSAHKEFDTDLRIHADSIINGHKTALAKVFYISGDEVSKNGTAFYKHNHYGKTLPKDVSDEDFDRLINEDSNDHKQWVKQDIVVGIPNRMLTYDSNYFHSKFPSKIERGVRKVLVCFYKKAE